MPSKLDKIPEVVARLYKASGEPISTNVLAYRLNTCGQSIRKWIVKNPNRVHEEYLLIGPSKMFYYKPLEKG